MDLQNLKWTKNIVPQNNEPWAYQPFGKSHLFKLAWRDNQGNADKPAREDLLLLRQRGYVTHLVRVLDYKSENDAWCGDFNLYRIVETLWDIGDWANPGTFFRASKVFRYAAVLNYEGGNAMYLTDLPTFKARWQGDDGLKAFQAYVHIHLNLA
ncbi:hypothetical protein H6F86_10440 [Phormidium sp. FACHB-592]|uniref:Uncharacterized protein n=1 Tax=Stenomitos frigidus AS-A4 TaxID=2933935 RepID=A0ABV0KUC5_9CYAN|nr:hypothetical protein [Phormidium sp. FACHB-592]MBD2074298.1 hypothetical protein [Phormidium sp. FACHB-592]